VLTLALSEVTYHWPESPQVNDRRVAAWREENTEENGKPKTAEENGEETDKYHMWGRRRNGLHDNFNLAVYVQFLVAADTYPRPMGPLAARTALWDVQGGAHHGSVL
jgi:hypothetical protein